ncbi:N-acetyltransferase [Actinoplanes lobatus]|uniref:N-acetyltransferase n=1 Tax=Actinoplanes lobatus TaxID=113568 RepID=A0A7W7MEF1_9ACTN|nr:GNAT family N-acetyltransferase [Actinoplanes lobatus]MBB4747244.1 diamine N-acetyltransferase [Actinoplanes lobatus]GGN56408.1 N-acetyltransferase [Actinoplanes lobatus]GIE39190.1 N-acetyltransferase [Actinoplanes lobatus]
MHLRKVDPDNYEAALSLSVRPDQDDLVAPVVKSLAEAYVYPEYAWPRLIYDRDELVGFVMAFLDTPWGEPSDPTDLRSGLWRLNIAAGRQGHGYGTFAVEAVCAEIRSRGETRAYVTYEPREGGPAPFYARLGFIPTGEITADQTVAVKTLT